MNVISDIKCSANSMLILIFCLCLIGLPVLAQDKAELPGLVVVEPSLTGLEEGKVDQAALANLASSIIAQRGKYKVISHEDIKASLNQTQKAILVGCNDEQCMAEIGAAMGAPYLYYSNVGRVGATLVVTVTIIDNRSVNVLQRQSITIRSYDRVVEAMQVATVRLLGEQAEMAPPPDFGVYIWTSLGIGAAAMVLGGVGTGMAFNYQDKADAATDQAEFNSYRDKVDTWNNVALAGYIAGGAFLATSLILFLVEPNDEPIEAGSRDDNQARLNLFPLREGGFVVQYGFRF